MSVETLREVRRSTRCQYKMFSLASLKSSGVGGRIGTGVDGRAVRASGRVVCDLSNAMSLVKVGRVNLLRGVSLMLALAATLLL